MRAHLVRAVFVIVVGVVALHALPAAASAPMTSVLRNVDGQLEAFSLSQTGSLHYTMQTAPNASFGPWKNLGGQGFTQVAAASDADGNLEVFVLGRGAVQHIRQSRRSRNWGPFQTLNGFDLRQIAVGRNADGRLEVFALGGDRGLWHIWQTAPSGPWSNWAPLQGQDLRQIAVGSNADGRLEVFALGGDRGLWHIWQTAPNAAFGGWSSLQGQDLQQIAVGSNADGRLEVFALGGDRGVWHIWQTAPNAGFGGWSALQGQDLQQIAVGSNADGRLEVFALGGDRGVWHVWQTVPSGAWGGWRALQGHDLEQITTGSNADGRSEVFALGGNGRLYHIWQRDPNGSWGTWMHLSGDTSPLLRQPCTPITVGVGVERCVEARSDGSVNLYLDPHDATPWGDGSPPESGTFVQGDEPIEGNHCGPTAGRNFLLWYGIDASYRDLAGEMKTNRWDTLPILGAATLACAGEVIVCGSIVASTVSDIAVKAGTLPRDLRASLYGRAPAGYHACGRERIGSLDDVRESLRNGNPVVYFESAAENNVHWAVITGLEVIGDETFVRTANGSRDVTDKNLSWTEFHKRWSTRNVGNDFVLKVIDDDVLGLGLSPFIEVRWCRDGQ